MADWILFPVVEKSSIFDFSKDFFLCFYIDLIQVRKLAYVRGNSVPRANLVVLDKLIAARHEFAEVSMPHVFKRK